MPGKRSGIPIANAVADKREHVAGDGHLRFLEPGRIILLPTPQRRTGQGAGGSEGGSTAARSEPQGGESTFKQPSSSGGSD